MNYRQSRYVHFQCGDPRLFEYTPLRLDRNQLISTIYVGIAINISNMTSRTPSAASSISTRSPGGVLHAGGHPAAGAERLVDHGGVRAAGLTAAAGRWHRWDAADLGSGGDDPGEDAASRPGSHHTLPVPADYSGVGSAPTRCGGGGLRHSPGRPAAHGDALAVGGSGRERHEPASSRMGSSPAGTTATSATRPSGLPSAGTMSMSAFGSLVP